MTLIIAPLDTYSNKSTNQKWILKLYLILNVKQEEKKEWYQRTPISLPQVGFNSTFKTYQNTSDSDGSQGEQSRHQDLNAHLAHPAARFASFSSLAQRAPLHRGPSWLHPPQVPRRSPATPPSSRVSVLFFLLTWPYFPSQHLFVWYKVFCSWMQAKQGFCLCVCMCVLISNGLESSRDTAGST